MVKNILTMKEILIIVSDLKKKYRRLESNYYNQWREYSGTIDCIYDENSVVFFINDEGIDRVYYFTSDLNLISKLLEYTPTGACIDLITKKFEDEDNAFKDAGYIRYLEYGRFYLDELSEEAKKMQNLLYSDPELLKELFNNKYGEKALVEDAEIIDKQLREQFDKYEAHFWTLDTLKENIKKGWVWVAKENGEIIASDMFEIQGKKCYGAYMYNRGSIDVLSGMLAKISYYLFTEENVTYNYCWMNLANKRAIRYNMQYNGFKPDGLYDLIYVKQ